MNVVDTIETYVQSRITLARMSDTHTAEASIVAQREQCEMHYRALIQYIPEIEEKVHLNPSLLSHT